MANDKKLSLRESIFMIAGGGIGAGVLTIPYLFNKVGLLPALLIILVAYMLSATVHTMVAELAINTKGLQMLSAFKQYLFTEKNTKVMTVLFFAIMSIMIFSNLSAYIIGGSEVIASVLNIDVIYAKLIFYAVSAIIVLSGIKSIAKSEIVSVSIISLVTVIGLFISMNNVANNPVIVGGSATNFLVIFSLLMFCFSSEFTVFQVARYIEDKKDLRKAVNLGLLINMLVTFFLSLGIVYASKEVTEVGIIGWSDSIGGIIGALSSIFVIFALFTCFWMMSFSMANIIRDETKMNIKGAWLIASIIPLLLTFLSGSGFLNYIQYASGAFAIIIIIMLLPAFIKVRSAKDATPLLEFKGKLRYPGLAAIVIGYVLVAVGALIDVV